ncbi:hypothetical protein ACFL0V_00500 [Nanoarchaeota archaeon]
MVLDRLQKLDLCVLKYYMDRLEGLYENLAGRRIAVGDYLREYEAVNDGMRELFWTYESMEELVEKEGLSEVGQIGFIVEHEKEHAQQAAKYGVRCVFGYIPNCGDGVYAAIPVNISEVAQGWGLDEFEKFELDFSDVIVKSEADGLLARMIGL